MEVLKRGVVIVLGLKDKPMDSSRLFLAFFGILFSFTALAGAFLTNSKANADDTTKADTVNISVSAACTMISGDNTYSTILNPGQESADLGPSNIKIVCNDPNGYSIYAIGYSGDTYTGTNHTKLIGTSSTISTGTSGDNSWWAMKLSAVTGTYTPSIMNGYSSYSVVPDTFTQVARLTGATDVGDSAEGSSLQAFYKIKSSTSQIADDYAGKVKYVLVHPNTAVPTVPPDMQDFTLAQCQTNATDHDYVVRDRRDGSEYTVRYINGNCWMTQNLRITGVISATDSNFSSPASFDTTTGGDLRGNEGTYTDPQSHLADSTDVETSASAPGGPYTIAQLGAWYNYCAASAGEVCSSQTKADATQDICPANWYLPTKTQQTDIVDYASLTSSIYGGNYSEGEPYNATTNGYWWSSTYASLAPRQSYMGYGSNSSLYISNGTKKLGAYIRCIRST